MTFKIILLFKSYQRKVTHRGKPVNTLASPFFFSQKSDTMSYTRTVECFDCHEQVYNLKEHRGDCSRGRRGKNVFGRGLGQGRGRGGGGQGRGRNTTHNIEGRVEAAILEAIASLAASELHAPNQFSMPVAAAAAAAPTSLDSFAHTKDVYCLLDVSGSMAGDNMARVKIGVEGVLSELPENDRFALITFDSQPYFRLKPRPVGQLRRQNEIGPLLNSVFAHGSTAIYDAIYMAVQQLRDKTRTTILNVLTDGEDNCSNHSLHEVLALVASFPALKLNILHVTELGATAVPVKAFCSLTENRGIYKPITGVEIEVNIRRVFV